MTKFRVIKEIIVDAQNEKEAEAIVNNSNALYKTRVEKDHTRAYEVHLVLDQEHVENVCAEDIREAVDRGIREMDIGAVTSCQVVEL